MGEYYDIDGNEITLDEWFRLNADRDYVRIARTEFDGITISTVLLGLDHGSGIGSPIIFETLVFGGKLDGEIDRYTSKESAKHGHERMVARVKEVEAKP